MPSPPRIPSSSFSPRTNISPCAMPAGVAKTCPIPVILTTEAWTEYTLSTSAFTGVNLAGGAKLPVGVWTHVAVTFDGTAAGSTSMASGPAAAVSRLVSTRERPCTSGPTIRTAAMLSTARWMKSGFTTRPSRPRKSSDSRASSRPSSRVLLRDCGATVECFGACLILGQAPFFSWASRPHGDPACSDPGPPSDSQEPTPGIRSFPSAGASCVFEATHFSGHRRLR